MFSDQRDTLRKMYFTAWKKHLDNLPVEPLEAQIIAAIQDHPEYHVFFSRDENQHLDVTDENPYMHLGLHLALREQINTDRPAGIKAIYQRLCAKHQDALSVEHKMIMCLEKILWEAQERQQSPDEQNYLQCLSQLVL